MKFAESFSIGEVNMFFENVSMNQFVNPQDTDKRYGGAQLDGSFSSLRPSSGYAKGGSGFRRSSLTISDTRSSDMSSFESSPPCLTPCTPVSATSASSSRRQSMIFSGNQQYYLSPTSPSPLSHSPRPKQVVNADHYSLQQPPESPVIYPGLATLMTDGGAPYCLDDDLPMTNYDYTNNQPHELACHQTNEDFTSRCEQALHTNPSASLSNDMVRDFSYATGGQTKDFAQPYASSSQEQMFDIEVSSFEGGLSQIAIDPIAAVRTLDAPFEYAVGKGDPDIDFIDDCTVSKPAIPVRARCQRTATRYHSKRSYDRTSETPEPTGSFSETTCSKRSSTQNSKTRKCHRKPRRLEIQVVTSADKKHHCPFCDHKFVRPEHLARHKKSKHEGSDTKYYPCLVHDCKDPKTGEHKMIKARGDNMAPHYNNTHFSWGNSDKSGKNRRISLKESLEIGLIEWDNRWVKFLEGGIVMDGNPKGEWKMLGYSIRETQDQKIKDIIPAWEGPDDATLKDFDFRWKMLLDESMDFETAMAVGYKMKEFERRDRGLLGVTMMESEEMGLKNRDPRWRKLLSGKMTIDESEILGVKHLNPAWVALQAKRRR